MELIFLFSYRNPSHHIPFPTLALARSWLACWLAGWPVASWLRAGWLAGWLVNIKTVAKDNNKPATIC